eukprot:Anaeramoba_ignava/a482295_7.p3 GENE.a482295_7~~a482295_7.p3  ORF type:complete len:188 (-),score=23.69 a482295_7:88-651(-)
MNTDQLLNQILKVLHFAKEDKEKLEKIHKFMYEEIYEEEEEDEIPSKYKNMVAQMADALISGMCCFLNPDTLEWEDIPGHLLDDTYDIGLDEDMMIPIKHKEWKRCKEIEPMESREGFKVMANFTDEVDDITLKSKLINALNNRRPFANFKYIVETSDYRQKWFDFRKKEYEYHVWYQIVLELEKKD